MFNKKKTYSLDVKTAGKMLENVFNACDTTPNKVPFDKIVLQSRQNLFSDNLIIVLSIVIVLLTFVCPLFFPHSPIFVSVDSAYERTLSVMDHEMTGDTFKITFDGAPLDLENCYMLGFDDSIVKPCEYIRSTNTIVFPVEFQEYNIFIFDVNGKCIHLLLSPKK